MIRTRVRGYVDHTNLSRAQGLRRRDFRHSSRVRQSAATRPRRRSCCSWACSAAAGSTRCAPGRSPHSAPLTSFSPRHPDRRRRRLRPAADRRRPANGDHRLHLGRPLNHGPVLPAHRFHRRGRHPRGPGLRRRPEPQLPDGRPQVPGRGHRRPVPLPLRPTGSREKLLVSLTQGPGPPSQVTDYCRGPTEQHPVVAQAAFDTHHPVSGVVARRAVSRWRRWACR
jgi:hypothetical protein